MPRYVSEILSIYFCTYQVPKTNATHFRQVVDDFEYNHEQNENDDITKSQVRDKIVELKMRVNGLLSLSYPYGRFVTQFILLWDIRMNKIITFRFILLCRV